MTCTFFHAFVQREDPIVQLLDERAFSSRIPAVFLSLFIIVMGEAIAGAVKTSPLALHSPQILHIRFF